MQSSNLTTPTKGVLTQHIKNDIYPLQSSRQRQKISIDRFGQIHRQVQKNNFAPLRRIDEVIVSKRFSSEQYFQDQKEELKHAMQTKKQINHQVHLNQLKLQQKSSKVEELLCKVAKFREKNQKSCKKILKQNEMKQRLYRQKQRQQKMKHMLQNEIQEAIVCIDRQLIQIAHEFYTIKLSIDNTRSEALQISQQTAKYKQEYSQLQKLIQDNRSEIYKKQKIINQFNKDISKNQQEIKISTLQISILRMQIHSHCRLTTQTVSLDPESDRKKILEKNTIVWPKNKNKNMTQQEIRDAVVIQLYPEWRKLLAKMSSTFIGYHQLLGYPSLQTEAKMPELSLYLPNKAPSTKTLHGKPLTLFIFYSPIADNYQTFLDSILGITGLDNGIIRVGELKLEQIDEFRQQIAINYEYMGYSGLKRIEVIRLKELSREVIVRCLPSKEQKKFMFVLVRLELPVVFSTLREKSQCQEAYDFVRRWWS